MCSLRRAVPKRGLFELRPVQGGFISKSLREISADQLRMTEIRSGQVHPIEFGPGKTGGCEVSLNEAGTGQIRSSQCHSLKMDPAPRLYGPTGCRGDL